MPQATLDKLRFVADVPDLSGFQFPEAPPDAGQEVEQRQPVSRVVVGKTGTFRHPQYGKFAITRATFDSFVRNFEAGIPTDQLASDFDHEPDFGGTSEANGWITKLDHDGTHLYATVEWLWSGAFAIREKRYRYVSPTWSLAYVDEGGVKRGPTFLAFGLTNRPFFTLPAVSISQSFSRGRAELCEEVEEPSDSRPRMSEFATFAKALGLSEDADEQAIVTAATEIYARSEQSLEDRALAEGKVIFTQAEADKLKADKDAATSDAEQANERIAKLEEKDADRAFHAIFDQGVKDLKLAPADEEDLRELFNARGEDKFAEYVERQTAIVNGKPSGQRGQVDDDDSEAPEGVDPDAYALDRKVQSYMREHDDVSYTDALDKVRAQEGAAV